MDMTYAGEIAALLTSVAFSIAPSFFTLAGRRVGSAVINRTRLVFAVVLLSITHRLLLAEFLPFSASPEQWMWFTISGVVGLALGDAALFQAFIMLGTRLTMLVFSLSPVFSAILAWLIFGEELSVLQILAIGITLAGVSWVASEQNTEAQENVSKEEYGKGLLFAVIAALGQSIGLISAKFGLTGEFPALSGQVIRMLAAMIVIWVWTAFSGEIGKTIRSLKDSTALKYLIIASIVGPFIGVWLSLVAIQFAKIGVASTLMSLPPLFLIPIGYYIFKEKITSRAMIGTAIALGGVAALFLV